MPFDNLDPPPLHYPSSHLLPSPLADLDLDLIYPVEWLISLV